MRGLSFTFNAIKSQSPHCQVKDQTSDPLHFTAHTIIPVWLFFSDEVGKRTGPLSLQPHYRKTKFSFKLLWIHLSSLKK